MKKTLLFIALISLIVGVFITPASAQVNQLSSNAITKGKAYANSQIDTSSSFSIGAYHRVGLYTVFRDSAVCKVYLDSAPYGTTTFTVKDSLTISSNVNAGVKTELVIRDGVTERAPGISNLCRFRTVFTTNNGTTTANYDLILFYR